MEIDMKPNPHILRLVPIDIDKAFRILRSIRDHDATYAGDIRFVVQVRKLADWLHFAHGVMRDFDLRLEDARGVVRVQGVEFRPSIKL